MRFCDDIRHRISASVDSSSCSGNSAARAFAKACALGGAAAPPAPAGSSGGTLREDWGRLPPIRASGVEVEQVIAGPRYDELCNEVSDMGEITPAAVSESTANS